MHVLVTGCTFYPAMCGIPIGFIFGLKKIKTFKFQMTFVSSEDYSQSPSLMVKGSRNSVKKKSVNAVVLRSQPLRNETPENERHSWP